jgi:hypothetical protein
MLILIKKEAFKLIVFKKGFEAGIIGENNANAYPFCYNF